MYLSFLGFQIVCVAPELFAYSGLGASGFRTWPGNYLDSLVMLPFGLFRVIRVMEAPCWLLTVGRLTRTVLERGGPSLGVVYQDQRYLAQPGLFLFYDVLRHLGVVFLHGLGIGPEVGGRDGRLGHRIT